MRSVPVAERIIFGTSVGGMLRALGDDVSKPQVKAALVALGVDPDRLLPGYHVPEYVKLMEFIGAHRFPTLQGDARDRELGREFIRGFGQTLVGKATLAMGKVLGPMRATMRLTRSMRSVNNYSTSGANQLTARSVEVWRIKAPWGDDVGWRIKAPWGDDVGWRIRSGCRG